MRLLAQLRRRSATTAKETGRWLRDHTTWAAIAGTVIALTFFQLTRPDKLLSAGASAVYDLVTPGPSQAERQVKALFADVTDPTGFWAEPPQVARGSRPYLIKHWERLSTERPHIAPARMPPLVELDELRNDYSREAELIAVEGYVGTTVSKRIGADRINQRFDLRVKSTSASAWCTTTLPEDHKVQDGDFITAGAVPLARGVIPSGSGITRITFLACPYIRQAPHREARRQANAFFNPLAESDFWRSPPDISGSAFDYLVRHWRRLNPYRTHAWKLAPTRPVSLDDLSADASYDGRLVHLDGYVKQVSNQPLRDNPGVVLQHYGLGTAKEIDDAWCVTARRRTSRVRVGDFVSAVGLVLMRGSSDSSGGGFSLVTYLICPSIARWPS